jgi:hypothetical protein
MHDRMKTALRINVGWGVVLLAAFAYLAVGRYSPTRGVMVALSVAYAIIGILALRRQRWAVAVSVGVAILIMIRWLPMVVVNFWMFAASHDLYRDSPATMSSREKNSGGSYGMECDKKCITKKCSGRSTTSVVMERGTMISAVMNWELVSAEDRRPSQSPLPSLPTQSP